MEDLFQRDIMYNGSDKFNPTPDEMNSVANSLENLSKNEEMAANSFSSELGIEETNYPKIKSTMHEFITDYIHKDSDTTDKQFLIEKFSRYPQIFNDKADIEQSANDIVDNVYAFENNKKELDNHVGKGKHRESWLTRKLEQGAKVQGVNSVTQYANNIDTAIKNSNIEMMRTIHNQDGSINQDPNLDGLMAETHHTNSFNIDAAVKEKGVKAEVRHSNAKNSVDDIVRDENGNIVQKYQLKYCKDPKATQSHFEKGNYNGQQKLVPEGQGDEIKNAKEKMEYTDSDGTTIESRPLSKEKAKAKQEQAQRDGKIDEYTWNDANKYTIARKIGRKAAFGAYCAVGFHGARIIGRRIWNWATGKENKSVGEDVSEFAACAIKSGASTGLTIATSGALTVAARSGWLGKLMMKTPAGHIAAAVSVGIENVKILHKFATGELSGTEALDQAGRATCSVVGSLALCAKGATTGAAIGSVLGPVGTAIGGIAGGLVGGIAGSTVGEAIFSGGKKIVSYVAKGLRTVASGIAKVGSAIWSGVKSIKSIFCW